MNLSNFLSFYVDTDLHIHSYINFQAGGRVFQYFNKLPFTFSSNIYYLSTSYLFLIQKSPYISTCPILLPAVYNSPLVSCKYKGLSLAILHTSMFRKYCCQFWILPAALSRMCLCNPSRLKTCEFNSKTFETVNFHLKLSMLILIWCQATWQLGFEPTC